MCSIYGSINISNCIDFSSLLHHRGPDGSGIFEDNTAQVVLGHTRLSIIDLSDHARQPMLDRSGQYIIVFNGEIYNYKGLRKELTSLNVSFCTESDTEVVLECFKQYGHDCVNRFRGMFAFCIYDKYEKKLFLARDRFGIKPLLYASINGGFVFCSELKPLIKSGLFTNKIDRQALADFLQFGSVSQPRTIIEGVRHLLPGHHMTVDMAGNVETERYYDFVKQAFKQDLAKISFSDAVDLVRIRLEAATRYHMVADVEVGAFLSGGIDSTAVVALMNRYTDRPIKTFSVGFENKTEVTDESAIAKETAGKLGCEHFDVIVGDHDVADWFDGFIDSIDQPSVDGFNTFIVSKMASDHVKVVLSGLGGDEIFAGYDHFQQIFEQTGQPLKFWSSGLQYIHWLHPNRYLKAFAFRGLDPLEAIFLQRRLPRQNLSLENIVSDFNEKGHAHISGYENLSILQKISACEIYNYLLNTLLRDSDVMSMAHSLELRPVLLDHELVETAFALPDAFKIRNGLKKAIFIESVKDLIPEKVYKRRKTGFQMPLASWMNGPLRDRVIKVFSSETAGRIFGPSTIKKLLRSSGSKNLRANAWRDFVLISWLESSGVEIDDRAYQ